MASPGGRMRGAVAVPQALARHAGPVQAMIALINIVLVGLYLLIGRSIRRNEMNLSLIFLFIFFCFLAFDLLLDELRS